MKNPWVIIGIIAALLFGGAIWYSGLATEQSNEGIEITDHVQGNPDAAVTLLEYSDLECPACAAFQPILTQVFEQYGDQLRFEYKHFPLYLANPALHPNSVAAALATEAAGQQGKFFEYHDVLFAKQKEWAAASVPTALFVQYAGDLGLNVEQFKLQMKSSALRDRVKADFAEGRALGITGTPTFFLNGEKMQYDTYQAFIEQIAVAIDPNAAASSTTQTGAEVKFGL